eukprot:1060641-Amphidinium_carterae.1
MELNMLLLPSARISRSSTRSKEPSAMALTGRKYASAMYLGTTAHLWGDHRSLTVFIQVPHEKND